MKCKIFSIAYRILKNLCSACILFGLAWALWYSYAAWLVVSRYHVTTATTAEEIQAIKWTWTQS